MLGHRFENWLFKELKIVLARKAHRSSVHYWRMSSGREVDFVIDYKPSIFPIEVTYSTQVQSKKVKNLKFFLEKESKAPFALCLYGGLSC